MHEHQKVANTLLLEILLADLFMLTGSGVASLLHSPPLSQREDRYLLLHLCETLQYIFQQKKTTYLYLVHMQKIILKSFLRSWFQWRFKLQNLLECHFLQLALSSSLPSDQVTNQFVKKACCQKGTFVATRTFAAAPS